MRSRPCSAWTPVVHWLSSHGRWLSLLFGLWDLSSLTGDWTQSPCFARWILYHWAAREFPPFLFVHNLLRPDQPTLDVLWALLPPCIKDRRSAHHLWIMFPWVCKLLENEGYLHLCSHKNYCQDWPRLNSGECRPREVVHGASVPSNHLAPPSVLILSGLGGESSLPNLFFY